MKFLKTLALIALYGLLGLVVLCMGFAIGSLVGELTKH